MQQSGRGHDGVARFGVALEEWAGDGGEEHVRLGMGLFKAQCPAQAYVYRILKFIGYWSDGLPMWWEVVGSRIREDLDSQMH